MKTTSYVLTLHVLFVLFSCEPSNPNLDTEGVDQLESLEVDHALEKGEMAYQDIVYVPIYSDIYIDVQNPKSLLAATLSIRNTSFEDSLFLSKIDYYNTDGHLVKSFIDRQLSLPPMATLNYVIEREDDTGGPGANFIVSISSRNKDVQPLIQAVMVGDYSNKGFSFITYGQSLMTEGE